MPNDPPFVAQLGPAASGPPNPAVIVVAGSGGSIGTAVVHALGCAGHQVVALGRRGNRPQARTRSERTEDGTGRTDDVTDWTFDAMDPGSSADAFAQIAKHFGAIGGVVDCTHVRGPRMAARFDTLEPTEFSAAMTSALLPLLNILHAALPCLRKDNGFVTTFASDAGKVAGPGQAFLASMAAAKMMLVRSLATEMAPSGIRINCISSSYIEGSAATEAALVGERGSRVANARRRAGLGLPDTEAIAKLATFLSGPEARHMTGQIISLNGGLSA